MTELFARVGTDHGDVVVDVEGDLEPDSAAALLRTLLRHQPGAGAALIVDLSRVGACDPAGLAALVRAKQAVVRGGGRFVLVAPGYQVARALRTTGLARGLEIRPTLVAARGVPAAAEVPRQRTDAADVPQDPVDPRGASTASARGSMT